MKDKLIIKVGTVIGFRTVEAFVPDSSQDCITRCVCGRLKQLRISELRNRRADHCGCKSRLKGEWRACLWCASQFYASRSRIKFGGGKYCSSACVGRTSRRKHGHSGLIRHPTYGSWAAMSARCANPKNAKYAKYGGRGIEVCKRWKGKHGYENFLADMGERPEGTSIERKDFNGNYEPSNCCWASPKQQMRNTRWNVLVTHEGKTQCLSAWAEETGFSRAALAHRLNAGWPIDIMLTKPPRLASRLSKGKATC